MGAHGPDLFSVGFCSVPTRHVTQNIVFTQYYAVLRNILLIISHRKNSLTSQGPKVRLFTSLHSKSWKILPETMKADDHFSGTAIPILLIFGHVGANNVKI